MMIRNRRIDLLLRALLCSFVVSTYLCLAARAQTYTLKTLVNFTGTNGTTPIANLAFDSAGNLYGTTAAGGDLDLHNGVGDGTVFEIAAGSNKLTTLANFTEANGIQPFAGVIVDSSGNLYGTTVYGGDLSVSSDNNFKGDGTVFKIAADSNTLTPLVKFHGYDGATPYGNLIQDSNGNLYGVTPNGGMNNEGTLFQVTAGSNTLTTLVNFDGTNGSSPFGNLIRDSKGNLYGTTTAGGKYDGGTLFKIAAGSNTLTTLVNFNGADGGSPQGNLIRDSSGNFYGTTPYGGDLSLNNGGGYGTVFKIAAGSNKITTLINFTGTNGESPYGGLTLDSMGNLYGTTSYGGDLSLNSGRGYGTVFKIAAGSNALSTLISFNETNGSFPFAGVTLDSDGNLYGTAEGGGISHDGTVFELSSTTITVPETGTLALLGILPIIGVIRRRPSTGFSR